MIGPAEFLHTLWGSMPPGLIQTWELEGKRSGYWHSAHGTRIFAGRTDVYTAVATAHKDHGRSKRARAEQALAIAGLWLDLDVDGPHKTGGIATKPAAIEISTAITAPTLLVDSGYGVHVWHLLDRPWRFTSRNDQDAAALASAQWYALHRDACSSHGWGLDHTHDLARLMRLPGTFNGKGSERRAVQVIAGDGPRYSLEQLLALAAQAGDVPIGGQTQLLIDGTPAVDVKVPDDAGRTRIKVEALIDNVPEFAAAWNHQVGPRAAGWSMSEYDLSLCGQAVQAGFTDQELADLIVLHRSAYGDERGKAARLDYLQRTIHLVRTPSERQTAVAQLQARQAAALKEAA